MSLFLAQSTRNQVQQDFRFRRGPEWLGFCRREIVFEIYYKAVETANSTGTNSIECGMNPTSIEKAILLIIQFLIFSQNQLARFESFPISSSELQNEVERIVSFFVSSSDFMKWNGIKLYREQTKNS